MSACRDARHVSDVWHHMLDFVDERGIKMVSYHSNDAQLPGSPQLETVEHGFPPEWVCHYLGDGLSKVDPIPQIAARLGRPFFWHEAPQLHRLTAEEQAYIEELLASELGDGLAMTAFGPGMRNAYVGLGFGGPAPDLTVEDIFELQCAVQIGHLRYCELSQDRQLRIGQLSARETEVLDWVSKGKSNGVIAEILGVSRHTVDTLLRRLFEKLGVHDRTTAAIVGLGSGVLQPR